MQSLALAQQFMEIFYVTHEFDRLANLFADNLQFDGPLFQFKTARDYIQSLKSDPPIDCSYELLESFATDRSAVLIYEFIKDDLRTPMSQLFEMQDEKISRILLIFDPSSFI